MATNKTPKQETKDEPGPKADALKSEDDWRDAVKKSQGKKKPTAGWPK